MREGKGIGPRERDANTRGQMMSSVGVGMRLGSTTKEAPDRGGDGLYFIVHVLLLLLFTQGVPDPDRATLR